MGNGDDRTFVLPQVRLKPLDALCVEVVGRLVKKQHVRLAEQQSAKCHTAALATGKGGYLGVRRRTIQSVHRPFELGVDLPSAEMFDLF